MDNRRASSPLLRRDFERVPPALIDKAGLIAGIIVTVVQQARITPLILHAETYESAAPAAGDGHSHAHDAAPHGHDAAIWAPETASNGRPFRYWRIS